MKKQLLIIFSIIFSSCSTPHSTLYINNSTCVNSLAKGMNQLIANNLNEEIKYEQLTEEETKEIIQELKNTEIPVFPYPVNDYMYYFTFQKDNNKCFMKLAGKESKNFHSFRNIFLDSYELDLCSCSDNSTTFTDPR